MIHAILNKHPEFYYYQGFNDYAAVFLLTLGEDLGYLCCERATLFFMSQFLLESFDPGITPIYQHILTVLEKVDYDLYPLMVQTKGNISFSISWILTWFAHDIEDLEKVKRIYDACLCYDSFVVYVVIAVIISYKSEIMAKFEPKDVFLSLH
jgi:TBC1 domain family member 20